MMDDCEALSSLLFSELGTHATRNDAVICARLIARAFCPIPLPE